MIQFKRDKAISKEVIALSIPIILSNISRVLMGLIDMAMVGHLGPEALAATGMGSLLLWVIMSMGIGLRTGVQTVSARRLGQKNYLQCSNALWNGIILASVVAMPLTMMGVIYSSEISNYFLIDKNVIAYCTDYISVGFFGLLFVLTSFAFQGFYISIKETKVHMIVTISSNMINVYLNAALIYGSDGITHFFNEMGIPWVAYLWSWAPFPAMEVKGAAIATLIAFIWMAFHYFLYLNILNISKDLLSKDCQNLSHY